MCDLGASFAPFQGVMRLAPSWLQVGSKLGEQWTRHRTAAKFHLPKRGPRTANRESDHALCPKAPELPRFVLGSPSRICLLDSPKHHPPAKSRSH